jgi:hypothetical protein
MSDEQPPEIAATAHATPTAPHHRRQVFIALAPRAVEKPTGGLAQFPGPTSQKQAANA